MNRKQRKAVEARQRKEEKKTGRVAGGIASTLELLEAAPLRDRLRTAWQLITKHRTRIGAANRKALGYDA